MDGVPGVSGSGVLGDRAVPSSDMEGGRGGRSGLYPSERNK